QSIEVLPDASFNYGQMAFILVDLERWDEAEAAYRRSAEIDGRSPEIYVRIVAAMQDKALIPQAIEMIMTETEWPHDVFFQPWFLIKLGAYEEAISLIEQYVDEDVAGMGYLNLSDFDPVRNDPRIQAILKGLNLAGT
ncbi:MAG: hypothetical protein O6931_04030, partial [Gammaproteobacteria bacterium]|nr:hypothetical protein [Gammaproteobacteria bacterium]